MTSAVATIHELPLPQPTDYLGPGHVLEVAPNEVTVEIRGGHRARAQMALSVPYAPAVGDVLLVIGKGDDHYVIGVLHGSGRLSLAFDGAVDVSAMGGPLTLKSDQRVAIHAPEVEVHAGTLNVVATAVVEKVDSQFTHVRDALDVHAGKAHTIVDDSSFLTAKNAAIVTEETMTINGDQIHLG